MNGHCSPDTVLTDPKPAGEVQFEMVCARPSTSENNAIVKARLRTVNRRMLILPPSVVMATTGGKLAQKKETD
jgi:hypothetical protein